jgi:hypothetical protein
MVLAALAVTYALQTPSSRLIDPVMRLGSPSI